ncbi:MAG TPA: tRNA (adenosine(37)-N6)-dimethylallyltransferase MiaA [Vicinamibacteria bacterium]|nr:tRNA (adenosine(37)-N6)-dimethylallyltransferase MiaA [Vicinamibacteria bacterium]
MDAPLIAIVGPTASGKSALALRLAADRGGEIVSCDSLQIYRGLDIGSAKPTRAEQALVPHHLIDLADPQEPFSAADYARLARQALSGIRDRGRLPVVVGGTGLYLRALLEGLFEGPSRDPELRQRLEAMAGRWGQDALHRLLRRVDPAAADRIAPADRVRVVRALEVFRLTREPLTAHHQRAGGGLTGFAVRIVGLALDRGELRARVERRTEEMWQRGLLSEVQGLLAKGYAPDLRPLQAIGYRQAVAVIEGRLSEAAARRDMVTATMRYAKRQMTWFRHQAEVRWHRSAEAALADAWRGLEAPGGPS